MTIILWLLPTAILAVGLLPLIGALRAAGDDVTALRREMKHTRALRPAFAEVTSEIDLIRAQLRGRRTRS